MYYFQGQQLHTQNFSPQNKESSQDFLTSTAYGILSYPWRLQGVPYDPTLRITPKVYPELKWFSQREPFQKCCVFNGEPQIQKIVCPYISCKAEICCNIGSRTMESHW